MRRILWCVVLATLMLCGLSGVFVTTFVMVGTTSAASNHSHTANGNPCDSEGECCSGEFCCWLQGQTPPTCATPSTQPTPEQPVKGYQTGKLDGRTAGENDPVGTNRTCPGQEGSEYCDGWYAGYNAAQQAKAKAQGSGISRILIDIGVGILIAIGVVIAIVGGAAIAGAGPGAAILARFRH